VRHLTLAFACATLLLVGMVRCAAEREGRSQAALAVLEANAHKASLAGIRSRAVTDKMIKASDAERARVNIVAANARKVTYSLRSALDSAEAVLVEMPDSAVYVHPYVQRLHASLSTVTERARTLSDSTEVILTAIADLLSAQDAERQAWLAERESNANALQAKDAVIRALERRECRVLGMRCPSRTTVATIAVIATAFVIAR
jgi:type IV secretory pathway VirJ component